MSSAAHGAARGADGTGREWSVGRRAIAVVVALEAVAGAVLIGVARRDTFGWVAAGVVLLAVVTWFAVRRRPSRTPAAGTGAAAKDPSAGPAGAVRVLSATSRSSGEVGVLVDEQGYAAALELSLPRGAALDLDSAVAGVAADPAHVSAVQLRVTSSSVAGVEPAQRGGHPRGQYAPVHRRVHLVLRFEPARARDVVQSRGGGSAGSRAALVAALDRASLRLRRAGVTNRVVDVAALETLLADDTRTDAPTRLFAVDLAQGGDVQRLLDLVHVHRVPRSVLSLCIDVAAGDQWRSTAAIQVTGSDEAVLDAVTATLRADDAVLGVAAPSDLVRVLPLGGGPGDLADVVTLERT